MKRAPLNRETILDAAVAVLDEHGMDGLSMRRLGTALGVEAMSLYHHLPNKASLLDGIHERILLSLPAPPAARSWQAFVRHQAHALHDALLQHPNAIPLFATRPAATAAAIERLDRYLAILLGAGFRPLEALSIVQLVAQLVVGHAMWTTSVEVSFTVTPSPPHVEKVERVLEKWDADRELDMGIDTLIAGFERLLS
jgi:AcrR family transcriptional regulator